MFFFFGINPKGEAKAPAGREEALHDPGVQRAELHRCKRAPYLQAFSWRSMPKGERLLRDKGDDIRNMVCFIWALWTDQIRLLIYLFVCLYFRVTSASLSTPMTSEVSSLMKCANFMSRASAWKENVVFLCTISFCLMLIKSISVSNTWLFVCSESLFKCYNSLTFFFQELSHASSFTLVGNAVKTSTASSHMMHLLSWQKACWIRSVLDQEAEQTTVFCILASTWCSRACTGFINISKTEILACFLLI